MFMSFEDKYFKYKNKYLNLKNQTAGMRVTNHEIQAKETELEEAKNEKELFISSSTEIQETSKNSKGQVEYFRIIVTVNLKIINKINGNIQSKNFVKEFTYNDKRNKFELIEHQNFIKDELIDKIINDIIVYLNS